MFKSFLGFLVTGAALGIFFQYLFADNFGKSPFFSLNKGSLTRSTPEPPPSTDSSPRSPNVEWIGRDLKVLVQNTFDTARETGAGIVDLLPKKVDSAAPSPSPTPTDGRDTYGQPASRSLGKESDPTRSPVSPSPEPIDTKVAPKPIASPRSTPADRPISRQKQPIRGIYLSRYQITNNADEQTIRERVRFYRSRGFNTIVQGVWGNGCTMYDSEVSARILGYRSCPNEFNDRWLDWLLDEAHKQGMQVHAYFEKGIKIDKNSPIYERAIARKWLVPGVDRTYAGIEHYVLDVEVPEIARLFPEIVAEFVRKYPTIDAVQWDDYLGYHAELPGQVDRTEKLTRFARKMIASMKKANPSVSFDICHHNPYWAKKYFDADWQKWGIDRVFIQAYNDDNYRQELEYARQYSGIAITDRQLQHLPELVKNPKIKNIFVFPFSSDPENVANLASTKLKTP
ncbi:family 10 glycosylhydrolase [Pannus brasiliensis CCIBt3594]|uniref:Family 10 glycosylhydrolase n=1 Tax=Pannus brasiliensis CCIBt3594 TaxID=1427578 RepID=A0AAW9QTG9_9CHRO